MPRDLPDSFTITREAWRERAAEDVGLSATAFRVAFVLSGFWNRQSGTAWPSVGTVAAKLGASGRTVQRGLDELIRRGFIEREAGGGKDTSTFRFRLPDDAETEALAAVSPVTDLSPPPRQSCHHPPDNPVTTPMTDLSPDPRQICHPNLLKEPIDKEPTEGTISQRFAEFWQQYPRRVAIGAAEKAYSQALEAGTSPAEILHGAMRYAASRQDQDPKFTKHPATWLRQRCWEDEDDPDTPASERRMSASDFAARRHEAIEQGAWTDE